MKKGRKDTPYYPITQITSSTPDLVKEIFGSNNEKEVEEDASASKKLRRGDGSINLLDYASESACSAAATPAPASPSAWSVAATPASTSGLEADEDAEARAFLGRGYEDVEDVKDKMAAKAMEKDMLVASPATAKTNKPNTPLCCMVYIGEDSMGPTHILFSKSAAWNSRSIFGEHINYVSEGLVTIR